MTIPMAQTLQTSQKKYKHGLVIWKFMPLHTWHQALISFASEFCDILTVAVCSLPEEPIPGDIRYQRTKDAFANTPKIVVEHITEELPGSSESSREISKIRSEYLKKRYPWVDLIVTSEPYGDYVAEYMSIDHKLFDMGRTHQHISATDIRRNPFAYWQFIPDHVKWYFVKKVCIVGSESTGKSVLTRLLAEHFDTMYVEEMARYLVSKTQEVVFEDLEKIAVLHAKTILERTRIANKLLFVDTDVHITKSYSSYLFNKELPVADWIEKANTFDLYLFLESDCLYVQDGTRLDQEERTTLSYYHKHQLRQAWIQFEVIQGKTWDERYQQAEQKIKNHFSLNS
jgi:HTH-type transcriptional regulator, transcriptional repressor of NAD biosynthesis genes